MADSIRQNAKQAAALSSVGAAIFLTAVKLAVGMWSGSLGILAEAAHSGLDLAAAVITYAAVRAAAKPPDQDHLYGHGKVENLSALFETLLLVGTCAWIINEAGHRLKVRLAPVEASWLTFAVMVVSIAVDFSRSRMLFRVAAEHRSQALEADALHFSTDIWGSFVVIGGLACVKLAAWFPGLAFLQRADALAALAVATVVLVTVVRLGLRTFEGLLDASPRGAAEQIKSKVEGIPTVVDCHAVRVRHSGPLFFVDLHITLDGELSLRAAHAVTEQVEQLVGEILPGADVTVHPEPQLAGPAPAPPAA